jgi:hypothetical protein
VLNCWFVLKNVILLDFIMNVDAKNTNIKNNLETVSQNQGGSLNAPY